MVRVAFIRSGVVWHHSKSYSVLQHTTDRAESARYQSDRNLITMSAVYAATYEGPHLGSNRQLDLWKIGSSDNPQMRVRATTGTLRTTSTLHKVWKGRGLYEYDAIHAAQAAFGNPSGEWFTAPRRKRKHVLSVIGAAIGKAHARKLAAAPSGQRRSLGRSMQSARDVRRQQRTHTRRAIVPKRFDPCA